MLTGELATVYTMVYPLIYDCLGNRTRAEDIRDHAHPYMRPGPFFPGQFPAANVQLLKDGRLAPTGMELGNGDPRLGTLDIGECIL